MNMNDFQQEINNLPALGSNWVTGGQVTDDEGNTYTLLGMKPMWIAEENHGGCSCDDCALGMWTHGWWGYQLTLLDSDGQEEMQEQTIYTVHGEWN